MAFLTGWNYRKPITLSRASGAVTNYQMKLGIGESFASPNGTIRFAVDSGGTLKTNLKAYFCLDGDANDNSSNGNAATTITDISYDATYGKTNKGASFNGSTSRLQCNDSDTLTLGAQMSIAFWAKPASLPASGELRSMVCKYDSTGNLGGYDVRLYNNSGTQRVDFVVVEAGGSGATAVANVALSTTEWSFIVARLTGSKIEIWVNNVSLTSTDYAGTPGNNTKKLNIGNFGYYTPTLGELGRYFAGYIDEVGLWGKSLSTTEMSDLYNGGKGNSIVNYDVDCGGLCKTDFSDLRFTAADGTTLLDYWIESISGTTPNQAATVWIEFDSIGTGDTTFYMYYGNAGASAGSNGDNTFLFFDDFSGVYPGTKWNGSTAYGSVSSGILTWAGPTSGEKSITSATGFSSVNGAMRSRAKVNSYNITIFGLADANVARFISSGGINLDVYNGSYAVVSSNWTANSYKTFDILIRGGVNARFFQEGTEVLNSPVTSYPPNEATLKAVIDASYNNNNDPLIQVDWILIRNYTNSGVEPDWGSWGAEEAGVGISANQTQTLIIM